LRLLSALGLLACALRRGARRQLLSHLRARPSAPSFPIHLAARHGRHRRALLFLPPRRRDRRARRHTPTRAVPRTDRRRDCAPHTPPRPAAPVSYVALSAASDCRACRLHLCPHLAPQFSERHTLRRRPHHRRSHHLLHPRPRARRMAVPLRIAGCGLRNETQKAEGSKTALFSAFCFLLTAFCSSKSAFRNLGGEAPVNRQ